MKSITDWWEARREAAKEAERAAAALKVAEKEAAETTLVEKIQSALASATEKGWQRAVDSAHYADDYSSGGCYLFSPSGRLYLMTVHRRGAIHFKRI